VSEASTRHRIFVAVDVAPHIKETLAGIPDRLGTASRMLRWVPPDNLHLTLRFLGEITAAQAARVAEAARQAARTAAPFSVTLDGLGAFPSPRRPRVVWVGIADGADRLTALARALEEEIVHRKFPREPRSFQPHLTVARVRAGGPPPDLTAGLANAGVSVIGTQEVAALVVMESFLHPSGPEYREVARASLGGG
jgi:RNA 2',3'-cyclic 3'-phosphodiesterase